MRRYNTWCFVFMSFQCFVFMSLLACISSKHPGHACYSAAGAEGLLVATNCLGDTGFLSMAT